MITSTVIYDPTQPTTRYPGEQLRGISYKLRISFDPITRSNLLRENAAEEMELLPIEETYLGLTDPDVSWLGPEPT